MPQYMLDTNMCIYLLKNQPEQVAWRFRSRATSTRVQT